MRFPARAPSPGAGTLTFAALFPTAAAWLYFVVAAGSPWLAGIYAACKGVQFGLPAAWYLGVRARPGTPPETAASGRRRTDLLLGVGTGLLMGGTVLAAYAFLLRDSPLMAAAGPRIVERIRDMGAATPVRYLLLAIFLSGAHSLLEEVYWRWFVFGGLTRLLTTAGAVSVSSLAFAAHHVIVLDAFLGPSHRLGLTPLLSLTVALAGAAWACQVARSGRLTGAWISHLLVDAALMTVGWDRLVAAS